tara:strand:- start:275 stop:673 length:399 start_codon:yes stop_codon:yes gene_type:complete
VEDLKTSICKIVKRYYKEDYRIMILSSDLGLINDIDKLLWTFEQISFIPHCIQSNYDPDASVLLCEKEISSKTIDYSTYKIVINLNNEELSKTMSFEKIIEFVLPDDDQKLFSRKKYLAYKENNIDVNHERI